MKKKLGINQLMLIVIIALFCDHIGWREKNLNYFMVQPFFILGRMVMPIVCYAVVEEFKITKNHRNFIFFMMLAWLVSFYPFNLYRGGIIPERQNLMYDILLILLALDIIRVSEEKRRSKSLSYFLIAVLCVISLLTSGAPVLPIVFGIFFYKKGINKQVVCILTLITVLSQLLLIAGICYTHFFSDFTIQKHWHENLYLIGYILALLLLLKYNGDGKAKRKMKFAFVIIYPIHFLVLSSIFNVWEYSYYEFYLYVHGIMVILLIIFGAITLRAKPSSAQLANILLVISGIFYMVGYYMELTSVSMEVLCFSKKIEFLGIIGIFMEFTRFMDAMFSIRIKKWVYMLDITCTFLLAFSAFSMDNNHLLYKDIKLIRKEHLIKINYVPGPVGYFFLVYSIFAYVIIMVSYWKIKNNKSKVENKRFLYSMLGASLPIISVCLESVLIKYGYYFNTYAVLGFALFFNVAFLRDDSFGRVRTEAETDPLTRVGNRRYFLQLIENVLLTRKRGALIMVDLDNFKYVNDNFGHGMGDKVLMSLGDVLLQEVSAEHYIARIGGDEFCIYLINMTKRIDIQKILEQLMEEYKRKVGLLNIDFAASLSIGVAVYSGKRGITFEQLYENADKALYLAKNSGKGQYKFFRQKEDI